MSHPSMTTPVPIPSSHVPASHSPTRIVVGDNDVSVKASIKALVARAGLSQAEISRRMGVTIQSIHQYLGPSDKRVRPSIQWVARLAEVCGGRVVLELPSAPLC